MLKDTNIDTLSTCVNMHFLHAGNNKDTMSTVKHDYKKRLQTWKCLNFSNYLKCV